MSTLNNTSPVTRAEIVNSIEDKIKECLKLHDFYWASIDKVNAKVQADDGELSSAACHALDLERSALFNKILDNKSSLRLHDAHLVKARQELKDELRKTALKNGLAAVQKE